MPPKKTSSARKQTHKKESKSQSASAPPQSDIASESQPQTPFPVVGVGASAGGLEAFTDLLHALPPNTNMAFVLVQHLDPRHGSMLRELLSPATPMIVSEAADGMRVEPNQVYVIPPNASLTISNGALRVELRGDHQMTIDHFFRSLAVEYGSRAVGVILSGTASDGTLGLKAIKAEGGITFAQDESSAKYDGMPRSAVMAGCVDFVLPPDGIASELSRLSRHPFVDVVRHDGDLPPAAEEQFSQILSQLRAATGVDFAYYKHATIRRRVLRRMALLKIEQVPQYADYLRKNPAERQALFADILINVTGFFREPATFDSIRDKIFPAIFKDRKSEDPVRIWVPGCATGEEAYSIAMVLIEYMRPKGLESPIQIFGTDLSESSLEKARAGFYAASISTEVSPERLRRFFVKVNGTYQISRSIRDICVFARQDFTRDPPFSRLDLISCRNVLIYLGPVLQMRAMRFFHYGLKPTGFLVLGHSESIGAATDLFAPIEGKEKIFSKKPVYTRANLELSTFEDGAATLGKPGQPVTTDILKKADQLILTQHSPPAVVVDQDLKVLQFRGRTSEFLEHPAGEPSLNLDKMTRGGLALEIRRLVQSARKSGGTVTSKPMPAAPGGASRTIRISVTPIKITSAQDMAYLVLFERIQPAPPARPVKPGDKRGKPARGAAALRVQDLEAELNATKQYLQSVVQEQEAAVEELKSAHEEVQSSNEELQSTNEELLTSKEELQSSNEELNTVNEEMQSRNAELQQINDDLNNLLASTNIPIVMLGSDLRIRRVTSQADKVLGLLPTDVGRKVTDFRIKINCPDLESLFNDVIENLQSKEREVQDQDNRTWLMGIRPYRTLDNKIDGAVMTLYDVTERREAAEVRYRRLFETARDGIVIADAESGEILDVNPFVTRLLGYPRAELMDRKIWQSGPFLHSDLNPAMIAQLHTGDTLRKTMALVTKSGETVDAEIVASGYNEGSKHVIQFNIRQQPPREPVAGETQAARLEAVGRLAGSLAHQFNNSLTSILGYCDLMLDRAGSDKVLREEIEHIRTSGEIAASLTRRLLAFGRKETEQPVIFDLPAVVGEMEQVLRVMLPDNIDLVLRADPSTGNIKADRLKVEQVITNLVLNARDAMPQGGRLTLETSRQQVDQAFSADHPSVNPGDYAVILVSDTGSGMTLETQSHLFEPFFTTKPRGAGIGLGLATIDRFVRDSGGCILAVSEFGRGTTFRIFLPHVDAAAGATAAQPAEVVRGSGSILLVEDDPSVRRVTRSILERSGYKVADVSGGPEALRVLSNGQPFDLLLTDVVMPGMSGRELADRAVSARPHLKVIYMSAYADDILEPHGVLNEQFSLVRKPFPPALLLQKITAALFR